MNKDNDIDIADAVINEQLNTMLEQERQQATIFFQPGFEQMCPFFTKEQIMEYALRAVVMLRISIAARWN